MKKAILATTLFLSVLSTSCGSDDDGGNNPDLDVIIGTWSYTQSLEDGQEVELTDCEKRGNYIFNTDNSSEDNFYEDGANSECALEKGVGTWTRNDDGTYTGTFADDIETYTTTFMLSDGRLIIEENEAGTVFRDIYTKS